MYNQHQAATEYSAQREVVPAGPTAYSQSPVVMIYGLKPEKMNCKKLFNVLCLYGNVMKVREVRDMCSRLSYIP